MIDDLMLNLIVFSHWQVDDILSINYHNKKIKNTNFMVVNYMKYSFKTLSSLMDTLALLWTEVLI